jgi:hypothetical protein
MEMSTEPKYRHDYDSEIKFTRELKDLHGLISVFSVSGRAFDLARGDEFLPSSAPLKMRFDYDDGLDIYVEGEVLTNPSWFEVWKAADRAIRLSDDLHHIFFEGARFNRFEGDVMVFNINTGS